jgi:hypothetical protein
MHLNLRPLVVTLFAIAFTASAAAAQIPKLEAQSCGPRIETLLLNKKFTAKVVFPASAQGIDITLDGDWDQKANSRLTKNTGVGIAVDDPAVVNQVKLKEGLLEIHLNGGGFGTFGDFMTSSEYQRQQRSTGEKASGGSRINLKFNRRIACDELTDAAQLMAFLDPLLEASSLKVIAARQAIPPEWAAAAAKKLVLVGMDKPTVFAIMGEPKQKQVDMASDPPIERWQFDLPDLKTRVVTFAAGKVTKVAEF